MIWNYVKTLKTCKSIFDVLEFSCTFNYTLDKNGKTTLLETINTCKLENIGHVITIIDNIKTLQDSIQSMKTI